MFLVRNRKVLMTDGLFRPSRNGDVPLPHGYIAEAKLRGDISVGIQTKTRPVYFWNFYFNNGNFRLSPGFFAKNENDECHYFASVLAEHPITSDVQDTLRYSAAEMEPFDCRLNLFGVQSDWIRVDNPRFTLFYTIRITPELRVYVNGEDRGIWNIWAPPANP